MTAIIELSEAELPAEFLELRGKVDTEKPKKADVLALRDLLDREPDLWRVAGDLTDIAIRSLIAEYPADSRTAKESARHGVTRMRRELGYEHASQLERLLIDQVVICWLHIGRAQLRYDDKQSQSMTFVEGDYWQRYLSASQRRLMRACETLARVQKMGPKIQVNIAQQQVVDNRR